MPVNTRQTKAYQSMIFPEPESNNKIYLKSN